MPAQISCNSMAIGGQPGKIAQAGCALGQRLPQMAGPRGRWHSAQACNLGCENLVAAEQQLPLGEGVCPIPVSYTHLGVYKRQDLRRSGADIDAGVKEDFDNADTSQRLALDMVDVTHS